MKKLLITCSILLSVCACTSNEERNVNNILSEFNIYSTNGKIGNDKFGILFNKFATPITFTEAKSFFDYRNSVQKDYNKIDFSAPIGSITIGKLLKICNTNSDGGLIFNISKIEKKIKMQIVGIKKYRNNIEVDGTVIDITDTTNYRSYVKQAIKDNKTPYLGSDKKPYIYFDKSLTKNLLELMKPIYTESRILYFYYGYSRKTNTEPYHPSLLFSIHHDLEQNSSTDTAKYAFANRGNICCLPF